MTISRAGEIGRISNELGRLSVAVTAAKKKAKAAMSRWKDNDRNVIERGKEVPAIIESQRDLTKFALQADFLAIQLQRVTDGKLNKVEKKIESSLKKIQQASVSVHTWVGEKLGANQLGFDGLLKKQEELSRIEFESAKSPVEKFQALANEATALIQGFPRNSFYHPRKVDTHYEITKMLYERIKLLSDRARYLRYTENLERNELFAIQVSMQQLEKTLVDVRKEYDKAVEAAENFKDNLGDKFSFLKVSNDTIFDPNLKSFFAVNLSIDQETKERQALNSAAKTSGIDYVAFEREMRSAMPQSVNIVSEIKFEDLKPNALAIENNKLIIEAEKILSGDIDAGTFDRLLSIQDQHRRIMEVANQVAQRDMARGQPLSYDYWHKIKNFPSIDYFMLAKHHEDKAFNSLTVISELIKSQSDPAILEAELKKNLKIIFSSYQVIDSAVASKNNYASAELAHLCATKDFMQSRIIGQLPAILKNDNWQTIFSLSAAIDPPLKLAGWLTENQYSLVAQSGPKPAAAIPASVILQAPAVEAKRSTKAVNQTVAAVQPSAPVNLVDQAVPKPAAVTPPHETKQDQPAAVTPPHETKQDQPAAVTPPHKTKQDQPAAVTPPHETKQDQPAAVTPPHETKQNQPAAAITLPPAASTINLTPPQAELKSAAAALPINSKLEPQPPPARAYQSGRTPSFFTEQIVQSIGDSLSAKGWTTTPLDANKTECKSVKGAFVIDKVRNTLVTDSRDVDTFSAMLDSFKKAYGENAIPQITTDQASKAVWEKVLGQMQLPLDCIKLSPPPPPASELHASPALH